MKFLKIFSVLLLMAIFSATAASAANERYAFNIIINGCVEKATGTEFKAVIQNESNNICVGTGLRTKRVLFKDVQVYAAAFYLDEKSLAELKNHQGDVIKEMVEGKYARIVTMTFLRDVSAEKLKERFLEGLKDTMPNPSQKSKEELDAFLKTMKDVKKGDEITIYFGYYSAGELKPNLVATKNYVVENKELSAGLLYLWFDDKPASPDLKKAVIKSLGGK